MESNNNYSDEQILLINKYAALFFTPREIAVLIGVDGAKLQTDIMVVTASIASQAYHKGKLEQEVKLREKLISLSDKNSITAQEQVLELIKKQQKNER
jgi:hypothetical protein